MNMAPVIHFDHQDAFAPLYGDWPISRKLAYMHEVVEARCPFLDRIAVALYDPQSDLVKTFVDSSGDTRPLNHYQARLGSSRSLLETVQRGRPRVVNDLSVFADSNSEHSLKLQQGGYAASYTLPMYRRETLFGFLFFNSRQRDVFDAETLHYLDLVGHLIAVTVMDDIGGARNLQAVIRTTTEITHVRDFETGCHLDRMARYARVIARELAPQMLLSDEFVEHLFVFAPLHDVGKIGVPDAILRKPGKLTADEYEEMKTHTVQGQEIVDNMLTNFGLETMGYAAMLRNIVEYHHEAMDGSGYPRGLVGEEIPLEARIVAVADVFDALTSERPYKKAWSNDEAFETLNAMAGSKLDPACVEALHRKRTEVEAIQARFCEDRYG